MNKIREYKGEKTVAQLTARLVPPNDNYPNCMCELVLTDHHLYVLEDNYDDTWTEHFIFPIAQIEEMRGRTDKNGSEQGYTRTQYLVSEILGALSGFIVLPGKKVEEVKLLLVTYKDGMGKQDTVFFRDLGSSSKPFVKAFEKVKEAFYA